MSFAREFYDWGEHTPGKEWVQFNRCSPNLMAIQVELQRRWPVTCIGCFNPVLIPGTTIWSTHAFGAAIDVRYYSNADSARTVCKQICGFLVAWSNELGVQAVHDYVGQRIWHAGRTPNIDDCCYEWWKAQRTSPGDPMGKSWATWVHIETTPSRWNDDTPVSERGVA